MSARRWFPASERPRLRRALLQELAVGSGLATSIAVRLRARAERPVLFVHVVRELFALEHDGLARSRRARRHPVPLLRTCRRFALTPAGRRALAREAR